VVIDEKTSLIGGINIADKYRGTASNISWLDYAVQIENKEIANNLQQLCRNIYFKNKRTSRKTISSIINSVKETSVVIRQNDWLKRKNEIGISYINAIRKAKNEVIIVGSYFLPGQRLMSAIKKTSHNGVKIKIILSGISDIPFVRQATCYLYSSLLKHNIELYEWNNSVLHGKAAVVDTKWATIGSFNLNHLSSYGSIEMNVEINSVEFSKNFRSHLNDVIGQCEKITSETIEKRNGIFTKSKNWLCYYMVRMLLLIATYIPYKRFLKFIEK
jgi:cardiolipin synthase